MWVGCTVDLCRFCIGTAQDVRSMPRGCPKGSRGAPRPFPCDVQPRSEELDFPIAEGYIFAAFFLRIHSAFFRPFPKVAFLAGGYPVLSHRGDVTSFRSL